MYELNTLEYDVDDSNLSENDRKTPGIRNEIIMENYFNSEALELDIRVVIEQEITNYDHRENDYDINALLDTNFNKVDGGQNKE